MAVLAVVGLVAAGAAYDRSDDAAGRSSLPLIGLTLSGNDVAHFERIYDRLSGDNREPRFYREHNRWRRAQLRYDGRVYTVRVKSHGRDPDGHSVERDGHRFISLSIKMAPGDRVAGLNRFKLIVGENLVETQQLVMTAAREAHVLLQDHRLVRVQINDWGEQLFHFSNLLDDEYTEAAGQASLRTVTYDYPDGGGTDKALVYSDSPQYRGNTYDFPRSTSRVPWPSWRYPAPTGNRCCAVTASSIRRSAATAPPTQRTSSTSSIWDGTRPSATSWVWTGTGSSWQPACLPEHGERQVLSRARS